MSKLIAVLTLMATTPLYAGEFLRVEGADLGKFFNLAHAPGVEIEATDEGLRFAPDESGPSSGQLYSALIDFGTAPALVRAEWDATPGAQIEVRIDTGDEYAPRIVDDVLVASPCERYFDRGGQEIGQAQYESLPSIRRGEVVTHTCVTVPIDRPVFAESGQIAALTPPYEVMQMRLSFASPDLEPFVLRSLVLYDDAGPTAVEAASWGTVKGRE